MNKKGKKTIPVENTEVAISKPNPLDLINLALEKGLDIEKLSRLFDLQERWEKKEAEKEFNAAFARFQSSCPEIKKTKKADFATKTGGRMSYSYVPLNEICKQIKLPMSNNGLSYRWEFQEAGALIECTCIISHISGHSKTSKLSAPKDDSGAKNVIQQIGSTHTYLQRYSLIGALGISSADPDNDGKSAKAPEKQPELSVEEKQKQAEVTERFKKQVSDIKTPTEIKVNYNDIIAAAKNEGANIAQLKEHIVNHGLMLAADLKKTGLKNNEIIGKNNAPTLL